MSIRKQGGPKVKILDYTIQSVKPVVVQTIKETQQPIIRRRRGSNNGRKSKVQEGNVVNGSASSRLSYSQVLQLSSNNDSNAIVVFGQKRMNLAVTQNETIVHKKQDAVKAQ